MAQDIAAQVAGHTLDLGLIEAPAKLPGLTSEVVREAMRHYMAEEKRAETLDRALQAGLDSGPAEPWNLEQFLTEMHARHQGAA